LNGILINIKFSEDAAEKSIHCRLSDRNGSICRTSRGVAKTWALKERPKMILLKIFISKNRIVFLNRRVLIWYR